MTGSREQAKSIFLAALMVMSVIAIGAAGFAGSAAAQVSNGDVTFAEDQSKNQNVTAGASDQSLNRITFKDEIGGAFGNGKDTIITLPDGITVTSGTESDINAYFIGSSGDATVTGVDVSSDGSTITLSHDEGISGSEDLLRIIGLSVDVATDIDASNDGTNADISIEHLSSLDTKAQVFNVHKPEIDISSANTPEIKLGTTDQTLEDADGGDATNFEINTTNATGQIGSGTTVTVTVGDGITWNTTNSSLPASNVVDNSSSALNVDTDNIDVTADAISIPVLSEANASSSPPQIALNNSGIAVDIAGDAPIDTNVSINATVEPTNSLGTVDVVSNAEINVTAPETRLEAPSNRTSVQKTQQPIGNVSLYLGDQEVGAGENVTISLNNSDVEFDDTVSEVVDDSSGNASFTDLTFQNGNTEVTTIFNESSNGGIASTGDEVINFTNLQINVTEGTTTGTVGFDASFSSSTSSPVLTISDNGNVTEYVEADAGFEDGADEEVFVDNDGVDDVGVNNMSITNNSIDSGILAINSSSVNASVDLSGTGITFNTSNTTLNNDSVADVTVSDKALDIQGATDEEDTINLSNEDESENPIRLDLTSDAADVGSLTATVYTGDYNYTTEFNSQINVSTAEIDNVNAPDDNSTIEVNTEITEEVEVTSTELNQDGVSNEFGDADVELSLQSSPDAFEGSITDLVDSTSIITESDGNASYTFSSGVTGEYVIDHNASESANETTTYTVNSGEIDSVAVEGVENAFRGVPDNADANEQNAVYKVEVLDANGNPATVNTDFEFQVIVDDGSSTSNLTALSDELPSNGQASSANTSVEEDGTAVDPFTKVDGNVFQYNPDEEDPAETNSQGTFYIYASSNVAGDIEVDVLPTNFASDSGTATFYEGVDTVSLDAPDSVSAGQSLNVTATAQTTDGTTIEIPRLTPTFESDNSSAISVDTDLTENTDKTGVATGNITAEAAGEANLTADISTTTRGSASDTQSITVTDDSANFEVSNVAPDGATVEQGDSITVTADIENTGEVSGTQDIEFRVDTNDNGELNSDETLATNESFSVDAGETRTVTFADISTANLETGTTYTHGVVSNNDQATASLSIAEEGVDLGTLAVDLDPSSVTVNETTDVDVTVTNASNGDAVQGATVEISSLDLSATTDENGVATLSVEPDTTDDLTVDVTADTFEAASETLGVTEADAGPGDVSGNEDAATDPDDDGLYEDVNGDGEITFADLQALYAAGVQDGADRITADNEASFNFNEEGGLTFSDLQALYAQELRDN